MASVEPLPGEPAAVAETGDERTLVVADYHAGIEASLRYRQGVELESRAEERRDQLFALLDRSDAERVLFLGDLAHAFGAATGEELDELETLVETLSDRVAVTVVKGNHDGDIETAVDERVQVIDGEGVRFGDVGFAHGHTWPAADVLSASVVCIGHEHPTIRMEDTVGGTRVERVWLRGRLSREPFEGRYDDLAWAAPELVVFPAFNDLTGGTWVNVEGQGFLSPFLPEALPEGQAYLLDGTRLGGFRQV